MKGDREGTPRVILDCMVLLQAARRRHSPSLGCLELAEEGAAEMFFSHVTFAEIAGVMRRPAVQQRFPELQAAGVAEQFLIGLRSAARLVDDVAPRIVLSRDPKDSPYLDLAIGVGADYLVTRDKDLLTLGTDDSAEAREFRRLLPGCRIVEPVDFLRYMNESRPA